MRKSFYYILSAFFMMCVLSVTTLFADRQNFYTFDGNLIREGNTAYNFTGYFLDSTNYGEVYRVYDGNIMNWYYQNYLGIIHDDVFGSRHTIRFGENIPFLFTRFTYSSPFYNGVTYSISNKKREALAFYNLGGDEFEGFNSANESENSVEFEGREETTWSKQTFGLKLTHRASPGENVLLQNSIHGIYRSATRMTAGGKLFEAPYRTNYPGLYVKVGTSGGNNIMGSGAGDTEVAVVKFYDSDGAQIGSTVTVGYDDIEGGDYIEDYDGYFDGNYLWASEIILKFPLPSSVEIGDVSSAEIDIDYTATSLDAVECEEINEGISVEISPDGIQWIPLDYEDFAPNGIVRNDDTKNILFSTERYMSMSEIAESFYAQGSFFLGYSFDYNFNGVTINGEVTYNDMDIVRPTHDGGSNDRLQLFGVLVEAQTPVLSGFEFWTKYHFLPKDFGGDFGPVSKKAKYESSEVIDEATRYIKQFDKNENLEFDFDDAFLWYDLDYNFIMADDINKNGQIDKLELQSTPDYTVKKGTTGPHVKARYYLNQPLNSYFLFGFYKNKMIDSETQSEKNIYLEANLVKMLLSDNLEATINERFETVEDTLTNDYLDFEMEQVYDKLLFEDSKINTVRLMFETPKTSLFEFAYKFQRQDFFNIPSSLKVQTNVTGGSVTNLTTNIINQRETLSGTNKYNYISMLKAKFKFDFKIYNQGMAIRNYLAAKLLYRNGYVLDAFDYVKERDFNWMYKSEVQLSPKMNIALGYEQLHHFDVLDETQNSIRKDFAVEYVLDGVGARRAGAVTFNMGVKYSQFEYDDPLLKDYKEMFVFFKLFHSHY